MDSIVNEVKTILMAAHAECAGKLCDIDYLKKQTENEAINKIDKYADEARRAYHLDPAKITEDARLFTLGVTLNKADLQDIAERNANNPTMLQLVNRYAKENGIKFNSLIPGARGEQALAENLRYLTRLYIRKWIDKPSGAKILDLYFTIPENRDGIE